MIFERTEISIWILWVVVVDIAFIFLEVMIAVTDFVMRSSELLHAAVRAALLLHVWLIEQLSCATTSRRPHRNTPPPPSRHHLIHLLITRNQRIPFLLANQQLITSTIYHHRAACLR